jgi:hypothetical protein
MSKNIPCKLTISQLKTTFVPGMESNLHITPKKLFLNIKQRDKFRTQHT